ncbi:hypothetical protein COU54_01105 [Candidatus Pacearchaeota archaeon CG10_big_fil_rev_8_21_14_0_10_31_24]|nr:MAG: hypothetical protein COU54_01105 [Candidatus Pacearchaeota archaeon CG10_big_fil_rev_8_21_14_0_10_31_24]
MILPECISDNLQEVQGENYLGLTTCEIEPLYIKEVIEQGKNMGTGGYHWKYGNGHIKKLRPRELTERLPKRFENSLKIRHLLKGDNTGIPHPMGLIYEGTTKNILLGDSNAYFITLYVEGENLLNQIKNLNNNQIEIIFNLMKIHLENYSEKGLYLLDFAPRDIILKPLEDEKFEPIFADTEHLEIGPNKKYSLDTELVNKQRQQFKIDYSPFLPRKRLNKTLDMMFK